jgi:hypothetical protein
VPEAFGDDLGVDAGPWDRGGVGVSAAHVW